MINELEEFVFLDPKKGKCLRAYLELALGKKDAGLTILKEFIKQTTAELNSSRIKNEKKAKKLIEAESMIATVQLDKEKFFSNWSGLHHHTEVI
jgi:hypothetical protein